MSVFNFTLSKNMVKLTLIVIASLSSTVGLRTELALILGDIAVATWLAIGWVFVIIAVVAYYKAKQDVDLFNLREFEKNRHSMGLKPKYHALEE